MKQCREMKNDRCKLKSIIKYFCIIDCNLFMESKLSVLNNLCTVLVFYR